MENVVMGRNFTHQLYFTCDEFLVPFMMPSHVGVFIDTMQFFPEISAFCLKKVTRAFFMKPLLNCKQHTTASVAGRNADQTRYREVVVAGGGAAAHDTTCSALHV